MAIKNAMFLFEVVVDNVTSYVESRFLVIKSDFSDIFSLELKDPKQMHIVIPDPPPLPPEPPGKKGKKAKPKPKKGKKGKKGAVELPPPEPAIQSGQSVLFTSNAEVLTQNMNKFPMQLSLWSKEDNLVFIGSCSVPWDPVFLLYLAKIYNCEDAPPPTVRDDYNIFQEGTAKIMAKLGIQVKLTYLSDQVVSAFRTLSEDPAIKKFLYTGMNSKTTSYICTLKTTDEEFETNCSKVENKYVKDRPTSDKKALVFADYKNVPGAKLPLPSDDEYCCKGHADKPPTDKYKTPETCPDIDFICDYVRKIITSCNDNMRMLTPRPTIRPRIKATDIDRLCYCKETSWPQGKLADRFKKEAQGGPCPICIREIDGKPRSGVDGAQMFDIANIRGPCGRPDCRIARDMRIYLENLFEEDNKEFNINEIIGPCGSKSCTLVDKIKDFLRHKGAFSHGGGTLEGLPTQCACVQQMQNALTKKGSCDSVCSHDCEDTDSDWCGGKVCPYKRPERNSSKDSGSSKNPQPPQSPMSPQGVQSSNQTENPKKSKNEPETKVYHVYYFTVEYDQPNTPSPQGTTGSASPQVDSALTSPQTASRPTSPQITSGKATPTTASKPTTTTQSTVSSRGSASSPSSNSSRKFQYCAQTCPQREEKTCSKDVCAPPVAKKSQSLKAVKCVNPSCPTKEPATPSPVDSDIVIHFDSIHNPCCVKTCSVAERVKDFIAEGVAKKAKPRSCMDDHTKDPCYCDCDCTFKFSSKTSYCPVCGGYECLGNDMEQMPEFVKPHPCPLYHKLYNKQYIKTVSPWPEESKDDAENAASTKSGKTPSIKGLPQPSKTTNLTDKKSDKKEERNKPPKDKRVSKKKNHRPYSAGAAGAAKVNYHARCRFSILNVPKHMGWLWNAEDIPGMKAHHKSWRPGAANKLLVRRYRTIREGVDIIAKKKRALMNRKKKIEMKPTLVVKKQDGEYTVQMEVFKKYSKERLLHQYPYEEKPPLIYTIGKTEETKYKIQKQRERRERRETRRKSRLLQSTFRDKCQEICLKAYNQAIGLLPLPNPNNPDCPCDVPAVKPPSPVVDSCSCSQSDSVSSSDTDGDEWTIEFTPPLAKWDAKAKHPPVLVDNECQYNYLDFKIKLLDKQGNPLPRFFKGPDGKQECSDLGGFWGPDHVWMEINKDGFIGLDNRWVPLNFTGPDGLFYLSEDGQFTDNTGKTWRIGIDGYVDKDGKWAWYSKRKPERGKSMSTMTGTTVDTKKTGRGAKVESPAPNAKPTQKSPVKPAIKSKTPKKAPEPPTLHEKEKKKVVLTGNKARSPVVNLAVMNYEKRQQNQTRVEHMKQMEATRLSRYNEIMQGLNMYDDLVEVRPVLMKTNRASNTPVKIASPQRTFVSHLHPMVTVKSSTPLRSAGSVY